LQKKSIRVWRFENPQIPKLALRRIGSVELIQSCAGFCSTYEEVAVFIAMKDDCAVFVVRNYAQSGP
jgi:hypothetical protein